MKKPVAPKLKLNVDLLKTLTAQELTQVHGASVSGANCGPCHNA